MIIQNISYTDIQNGNHYHSDNIGLIQIVDPYMEFPMPCKFFNIIYRFEFCDSSNPNEKTWNNRMSECQAKNILFILEYSLNLNRDIIIQGISGHSRSGAIVEAGLLLGFNEINKNRQANIYMLSIFNMLINK